MYEGLIDVTYSQARTTFKEYISNDAIKRIIVLKNTASLNTLSSKSDVVLYYSVLQESTPLLLVERLTKEDAAKRRVKRTVKRLNKELDGYVATMTISGDKKFVDIVLTKGNVYESLIGMC